MTDLQSLHIFLYGRVQGVGCRYQCQRLAHHNAINGWVCNRPDGSVEILAEGNAENLNNFLHALKRLPPPVHIDRLVPSPIHNQEHYHNFRIVI